MLPDLNPDINRRLEKAVMDIFSNNDFHKVGIRDVAQKAGISFSTIYNHFGSKEKLLFAYLDIWLGKLTDRISDHLQGIEDLKEKLRKVFWLQLDYYERHPEFGRILFMTLPMKTWMEDETFKQEKMISTYLDVIHKGQKEGILNPKVRAGVLLDVMLGLVRRFFFMWVARGQTESLAEQANVLFDILWRAISNPNCDRHDLP
ncbi:TetR/AcrR family transcriptional regulator [bacterium]|nr:TetR/AcrR family transcriptional regulator [bacterium]